jgi:transposase
VSPPLGLVPPVPEDTARVARAAFPDGNPYLRRRDELGTLVHDADFAGLYPLRGQPALAPWRLALITVLQFREALSDRPAADAVRARIDWKYLLGLELTDPGFDASLLREFRSRLLVGGAEGLLLEKVLDRCKALGLLKARGRQRTDSTHVLARVRATNRLGCAIEALRHALNSLAVVAPD